MSRPASKSAADPRTDRRRAIPRARDRQPPQPPPGGHGRGTSTAPVCTGRTVRAGGPTRQKPDRGRRHRGADPPIRSRQGPLRADSIGDHQEPTVGPTAPVPITSPFLPGTPRTHRGSDWGALACARVEASVSPSAARVRSACSRLVIVELRSSRMSVKGSVILAAALPGRRGRQFGIDLGPEREGRCSRSTYRQGRR